MNRQSTEDFQDRETTLYDTMMMDTCQYTFVKVQGMHNTKREPEYKLWTSRGNDLSAITNVPPPGGGWGCVCGRWRQEGCGKSLLFLLNFPVNLKLLKKIKSIESILYVHKYMYFIRIYVYIIYI